MRAVGKQVEQRGRKNKSGCKHRYQNGGGGGTRSKSYIFWGGDRGGERGSSGAPGARWVPLAHETENT